MKNLILLILCFTTMVFTSCKKNGNTITQTYNLPSFRAVSIQCSADLNVRYDSVQTVKMTGADNLLENLDMYVDNGTLIIKMKFGFYNENNIVGEVTIPTIDFAEVTGSGNIFIDNFTGLSNLELKVTGSGNISTNTLDLTGNTLTSKITGSGNIEVKGQADVENVTITGSGDYKSYNFLAGYSFTEITGSGNAEINISNDLHVKISGSGDVYYKGNPTMNVNVSGSGRVVNKN